MSPVVGQGAKLWANAAARAALAGAVLHQIEGDDGRLRYVLTCGHITHQLRTLDEVDACLQELQGVSA